jgi:hypothetical protein
MDHRQRRTLELLNASTIPEMNLIVPRGTLPETLETEICSSDSVKLLVAGQRGMGKTTELRRLAQLLQSGTSHLPVFVAFGSQESISETALVLSMANALYAQQDLGLTERSMREIRDWESTIELGEVVQELKEGTLGIGSNIPIISVKGAVGKTKTNSRTKKKTVLPSKIDLVSYFNKFVDEAQKKVGRSSLSLLTTLIRFKTSHRLKEHSSTLLNSLAELHAHVFLRFQSLMRHRPISDWRHFPITQSTGCQRYLYLLPTAPKPRSTLLSCGKCFHAGWPSTL